MVRLMMLGKVNDRYRSFQESFVIFLSSFNFCLFLFLLYQSTQDMAYRPTTGSGVSSLHWMWRTVPPQDLIFLVSYHRVWQGPNTAYLSLWCPTIEYGGPTTGYLSLPFLFWRNCKYDCFV